jgi:BirA family biotin operon repressor/biotin-[acetyl-CoA-carboxylase] ligase
MIKIGSDIIRLKETDSTNRYLMDWLAKEKPAEGTLVIAEFQAAGRGTDNSVWESEAGSNLTFSFVIYPSFLAIDAQFYLNKIVSLGLSDCLNEILPGRNDIRIKWPNDIYVGNKKIAGTLIQIGVKGPQFDFAIIGIGLNVNQEAYSKEAGNPVSLKMLADSAFDLEEILVLILEKLNFRLNQLIRGKKKQIDEEYLGRLFRFNTTAAYFCQGKRIEARITGVNQYGQLILEVAGGKIIECDLKELKFEI